MMKFYISVAFNGLALQFIWFYYVPPWIKRGFVPASEHHDFASKIQRDDLSSLNSVYEHLEKVLFEIDRRIIVTGHVPTHRLQLALAAFIVKMNQEFAVYWNHNEGQPEEFIKEFSDGTHSSDSDDGQFQPANVTELTELRDRVDLTDWAYLESTQELQTNLQTRGYILLRHDNVVASSDLGHFLAFHPTHKEFIICIKGTSNNVGSDLMTDLMGTTQEFTLPNNPYTGENSTHTIWAHGGMMTAAMHLLEEIMPILQHFVLPNNEFQLVVHGHSLGGGCAALLGTALRAYLPEHRHRIQVYAFAPAAVLDKSNAMASGGYITSVVNRADVVPRISLMSVQILMNLLVNIDVKLEELRIIPKDAIKTQQLIHKLLTSEKAPFFATPPELRDMILDAMRKVDDDNNNNHQHHLLMAPGRLVVLYEKEKDHTYTATGSFVADGTNPKVKFLQVERTLFTDHMRTAYVQSLEEAIEDQATHTRLLRDLPKTLRGKLWSFFIHRLEDLEDRCSPTTRLDSPFAAIVIASILLGRMIATAVATNAANAAQANAAKKKKMAPIKTF